MTCDLDSSVPDWLIDHPETAAVFDAYRVDTSCGGKSVRYLCVRIGVDPEALLGELHATVRDHRQGDSGGGGGSQARPLGGHEE